MSHSQHTQARPAGHFIVEALIEQGITHAFGVPGESYLPILDGLHEHRERIAFVSCRQEGGAAFMAEAAGKLTGRPGVCMVTRGPGATNASIGIHTAFQDSTPMVVLVGQVGTDVADREGFQEVDYRAMFAPLAKWVAQVERADRLGEYLQRAFHTALNGRPGPVVLALPEDVLSAPVSGPVPARVERTPYAPVAGQLDELALMLAAASRPLLLLGGSGWSDESLRGVARFAQAWQLPVACAWRFQSLFDNDHALYAGDVGLGINPKLAQRLRDTDLLLCVGARLGEVTTGGYELLSPPRSRQTLVHVLADADELGRVYRPDLGIVASMDAVGAALGGMAAPSSVPWAGWAAAARADYVDYARPVGKVPGGVNPSEVVAELRRQLRDDAIVTNGAGNFAGWLHRFFQHRQWRTQLAPSSGAMGYGLPAAVAAATLQPTRQVVCVAGDGDFLMTGQELATARQTGAKVVTLLFDNGLYGTIRMHQEMRYPGRVSGSTLFNPDFVQL
ncbi:MAG: thiamine pyrophosphate-binding protein, partial [Betaproteobacteria bacterium]|nr:thiamine pyrophosphate-binding protein [Betaproteobacteria bacterium]